MKEVPSSLGIDWPRVKPDDEAIRAPRMLNEGTKVAILVGQGARGGAGRSSRWPNGWGRGWRRRCSARSLGRTLPFVTGSIGLLGTRPSYDMMMGWATLLTMGSNFPYTEFMPKLGPGPGGSNRS